MPLTYLLFTQICPARLIDGMNSHYLTAFFNIGILTDLCQTISTDVSQVFTSLISSSVVHTDVYKQG